MAAEDIKSKTILIICLLGNPSNLIEGGYHRTIFELIQYFKDKNWYINIVTFDASICQTSEENIGHNIKVNYIPINPVWVKQQNFLFENAESIICQIKKIICAFNELPFVLHSFHWFSGYIGSILSLKYKIPQIHNVIALSYERLKNGIPLRSKYQRYCENQTFNHASLIITISESEQRHLIEEYGVSKSKIALVGRNVASCFYTPSHTPCGNLDSTQKSKYISENIEEKDWWALGAFCYFGRIITYKGLQEIIIAWESLYNKYQNLMPPLWIIGGDTDTISEFRRNHLKSISKLNFYEKTHKIYWWGYLDSRGISNILLKSSLVIMHSHFEPGGRVVIEAMAAGKPIIGTACGFAESYIYNWYNGFIVSYGNIKELAKSMEFFIKNKYLSNMMGINSKEYSNLIMDSWSYFERIENIYEHFYSKITPLFSNPPLITPSIIYPYKIDIFPYCDIKNSINDIKNQFDIICTNIQECSSNSYIWKINSNDSNYVIKQYYNRLNIKQLWNNFDEHQVHTIWMLYNSSVHYFDFKSIVQPIEISEKLFSFCIPYGKPVALHTITNWDKIRDLIHSFHFSKSIFHTEKIALENKMDYFQRVNKNIQPQHKYYSLDILLNELNVIMKEHLVIFPKNDFGFDVINLLNKVSPRVNKKWGVVYGKSFVHHIIAINNTFFLLPSADIYWGEIGYDEGKTFLSLYQYRPDLKHNLEITSKLSSISLFNILIWASALLLEKYISNKILNKTNGNILLEIKKILEFLFSGITIT